jgi:hypothetical protein
MAGGSDGPARLGVTEEYTEAFNATKNFTTS